MVYDAEIIKIDFIDAYEGRIRLKCKTKELLVCYQLPSCIVEQYFVPGNILLIDLWLFYADSVRSLLPYKQIPNNSKIAGGVLRGKVTRIFNSREFRMDCGIFEIDVLNEHPITVMENEYMEAEGSYYVFLPELGCSKEEYWG